MRKKLGLFIAALVMSGVLWAQSSGDALSGPCEADLQTFCSSVSPGGGRVSDCLARYQDQLSGECQEYLQKSAAALKNLREACAGDAQDYCRNTKTSFKRIVACLKENYNDISRDCKALLKK
jgi:hypothetical protein